MFRSFPKTFLSAFTGCLLATTTWADTVTLKSGEKIEGKVTKETDAEVTVEIRTGGVVDERTVKKAEVESVSKVAPDEVAWQALKGLKLGEASLATPEQYDVFVGPLHAFVSQYGTSTHKADVEKILAEFEAEKKRVEDGEVKLKGAWLSKEQVQKNRYQVNGAIAANYMALQLSRNDTIGAMNTFEILQAQYGGSRGYVESMDAALRTAAALKTAAAQRLTALPAEDAERQRGLKAAAGLDQIQIKRELEAEKTNNDNALAAAKKAGLKWPPFLRRSDAGLKEIAKQADETLRRLATVDQKKALQSLDLAEQAQADLEKGDVDAAEKKQKDAQQLWAQNEISTRLGKEIAATRTAAKEAAAAAAETAKEEPVATPKPAATPRATPINPAASTTTAKAEKDESGPNWILIGVAGTIAAILIAFGVRAYQKVRKKSNEIIA